MAIAVRTDTFVAPTLTQQTIYNAIKIAAGNVSLAIYDEYTSGTDKIIVYSVTLDNTKTFGISYLRIRLTLGLILNQQIYSTWNATTHVGTNGSTEITYVTLVNNIQINFVALDGQNEYKLIALTQGTTTIVLGFVAPINKPLWWDLNAWNYVFIVTGSTFATFRTTALNPYANAEHDTTLNTARMGVANPQTNRRDLLPGVIFYTQNNQGISGRSSDDLVMFAGSGTTRYDVVQVPGDTKQYLILSPQSGGLAVRFA